MSKGLIHIDPINKVYEINGKDFGEYCTGAEIKITPDSFPKVTLHLEADTDVEVIAEIQAVIDKIPDEIEKKELNPNDAK